MIHRVAVLAFLISISGCTTGKTTEKAESSERKHVVALSTEGKDDQKVNRACDAYGLFLTYMAQAALLHEDVQGTPDSRKGSKLSDSDRYAAWVDGAIRQGEELAVNQISVEEGIVKFSNNRSMSVKLSELDSPEMRGIILRCKVEPESILVSYELLKQQGKL